MQNIFKLLVFGLLLTFIAACVSEPDYPNEPVIEYLSLSKLNIAPGSNSFTDSLTVFFKFTDGDGNLGGGNEDNSICTDNCTFNGDSACYNDPVWEFFAIDLRDSCYQYLTLPDVEPSGNIKAISGQFEVTLNVGCKCLVQGCPPTEYTAFDIVIRDRANNYSNVIRTDSITITCN